MPINNSTSPAFFRWRPTAWLRVTGDDAAVFLQGQFTNELRQLAAGEARYGLWLSVKGKVLADSFVIRGREAGEFWIGSYFSTATVICERLEGYIIADDVAIADETEAWAAVSVLGGAAANAPEVRAGGDARSVVFPGRRDCGVGRECVFRIADGMPEWFSQLIAGATELSADDVARRRIFAGIPAVPVDVGPGDLPNEAGLEADAISFTKGCYLGQEVMARLKSMGQVRRRLLRVRGTAASPPAATPLFLGERRVGEVRSAVADDNGGWIGFAMISLLAAGVATEFSLAPIAPVSVRLADLP